MKKKIVFNLKKATEVTYKGENFDRIKKDFEEYIQKKEKREKLLVFDE